MSSIISLETLLAQSALIAALESEKAGYLELVALLDEQHDAIVLHAANTVFRLSRAIEEKMERIKERRVQRESAQKDLAGKAGVGGADLASIADTIGEHDGLLIRALVDEINMLLMRARHRTEQNQMLMANSMLHLQRATKVNADQRVRGSSRC